MPAEAGQTSRLFSSLAMLLIGKPSVQRQDRTEDVIHQFEQVGFDKALPIFVCVQVIDDSFQMLQHLWFHSLHRPLLLWCDDQGLAVSYLHFVHGPYRRIEEAVLIENQAVTVALFPSGVCFGIVQLEQL